MGICADVVIVVGVRVGNVNGSEVDIDVGDDFGSGDGEEVEL